MLDKKLVAQLREFVIFLLAVKCMALKLIPGGFRLCYGVLFGQLRRRQSHAKLQCSVGDIADDVERTLR